jgi:two-component system, NarL family, invasion response regulator UvrY
VIRILLVDDHALLREGTRQVLQGALADAVIAEAGSAEEASAQLAAAPCDLLVLDLHLPGRSGLELLEDVRGAHPQLKVLVLSASPEEEVAIRCLRLGAAGYLTKASAASELVVATRKLLGGGRYVSTALAELMAEEIGGHAPSAPHEVLSPRELQVLRLVAGGHTLREIGLALHLSEKTVATYRARIAEKLAISRIADLTRYAMKHGLTE